MSIYIRGGKIYGYEGEQTQEGILEFMSADNWKDADVLEQNFEKWAERVLGFSMSYYDRCMKFFYENMEKSEKEVKKYFKKIPYADRWSPKAQMLVVAMAFIPPLIFTAFWLILWVQVQWHNSGVDSKYARINAEALT